MSSAESSTPLRPESPKDKTQQTEVSSDPTNTANANATITNPQPAEDKDKVDDATPAASSPTAATATIKKATPATPTKPAASKSTASRKARCNFKSCNALAQRVVGDCGFCNGKFCGKHRLLESHACSGLQDCKDEAHERNRERLETERTVVVKGV